MKFEKSKTGINMLKLNDTDYISFGRDEKIKTVLFSQIDRNGVRESVKVPVDMKKLPRSVKSSMGESNLQIISDLFGMFVENGTLDANKIKEMENEL